MSSLPPEPARIIRFTFPLHLQMAGFAILRPGENLPDGTATMSDSSSTFKMTASRTQYSSATKAGGEQF